MAMAHVPPEDQDPEVVPSRAKPADRTPLPSRRYSIDTSKHPVLLRLRTDYLYRRDRSSFLPIGSRRRVPNPGLNRGIGHDKDSDHKDKGASGPAIEITTEESETTISRFYGCSCHKCWHPSLKASCSDKLLSSTHAKVGER